MRQTLWSAATTVGRWTVSKSNDTLRGRLTRLSAILLRADDLATTAERAAVVAWLRAQSQLALYEATPDDIADRIERGDHCRREVE